MAQFSIVYSSALFLLFLIYSPSAGFEWKVDNNTNYGHHEGIISLTKAMKEGQKIKLLCFVWMSCTKMDENYLKGFHEHILKCDDYYYFTDENAPSIEMPENINLIKVPVYETHNRSDRYWLYHKNMAGIVPAWTYLFDNQIAEKYDWIINVELDMVVLPDRVRENIVLYSHYGNVNADTPAMYMFGNAFLWNKKYAGMMAARWDEFKVPAKDPPEAAGCPEVFRGKNHWPMCPQDISFKYMAPMFDPKPVVLGNSGCGKPVDFLTEEDPETRSRRVLLRVLSCYEMSQNPFKNTEEGQQGVIRQLAIMRSLQEPAKAQDHYKEFHNGTIYPSWEIFFAGRQCPIVHHVKFESVHKLARQLLD
eukprot:m.343203 g.343203  ORF g.343203 m.343203 type:complete len:363 (+) comp22463_c0_seq1:186-1274(+)